MLSFNVFILATHFYPGTSNSQSNTRQAWQTEAFVRQRIYGKETGNGNPHEGSGTNGNAQTEVGRGRFGNAVQEKENGDSVSCNFHS